MPASLIRGASLTLRPVGADDGPLLRRIFASTRDDLACLPLPEAQKAQLIEMQFRAQDGQFRGQYPGARFDLVLLDGAVAGRLYVDHREDEIELIDIALLPQYRQHGIGSALLRQLLGQAAAGGCRLLLQVARNNRALRLYQRAGFEIFADSGVYFSMEWNPEKRPGTVPRASLHSQLDNKEHGYVPTIYG